MGVYYTSSPEQTEELGRSVGKMLKGGEVIALCGGLGMGKTAFTRGLASALDFNAGVSSPTFALVHDYHGRHTIHHFDMYRVNSWDDLYSTGFFDYLDTDDILVIEWSENIEGALPENTIKIEISKGENEDDRIFRTEGIEI